MEIQLANSKKNKVELSDAVFGCAFNEPLVHQIVTAFLSAQRAGTQAQKTRAEVRGGGAKPFKQKGGGRARCGTIRSPLWRKGGVIFAAKPRSYEQKVNKKMYRGAIRSILSELLRTDRMLVVESFEVETPKTKEFIKQIEKITKDARLLIIVPEVNETLYLASRNLNSIDVIDVPAVDPVSLISAEKIIITVDALKQLEVLLK